MQPIKTDMTSTVLGAPKDWDAEANGPCAGLPVTVYGDQFYSYWKASWRERLAVLFGRPVRLVVASRSHPPVMIDVNQ